MTVSPTARWLHAASADMKTALTVKLEAGAGAATSLKWAYCTTPLATPTQINVQVCAIGPSEQVARPLSSWNLCCGGHPECGRRQQGETGR